MPSEFRKVLLKVADGLSKENYEKLLFLLDEDIPKTKQEGSITTVFDHLICVGLISDGDTTYLQNALRDIQLAKLAVELARYDNKRSPREMLSTTTTTTTTTESIQPEDSTPLTNTLSTNNYRRVGILAALARDHQESDEAQLNNYEIIEPIDVTSSMDRNINIESQPDPSPISFEDSDIEIFAKHPWSNEFLEKLRINLRPYEYQRELVQNAIAASNSIICLRTGAGKTFVASLLIKYYLLKKLSSSNGEPKKFLAFFIVPRRAMLAQQVEKAKQFADLRIAQCDEYVNLVEYTEKYDIIACTPQKLLNSLMSKTLFLSNIDLLCFDDCYDPASQNQYDGIMQYLLCTKVNSIPPVDRQPIIIGLTATIGSQRSTSSEISRNLTQLCARFNCSTVTTVSKSESKDELDRCVNYISDDEIICVERSKSYDKLRSQIEDDLRDFIFRLFLDKDTNPSQIFPDKDPDQNGYEQCLELLKRDEERARNVSFVFLIHYVLPIYRHFKSLYDLTPELVLSNLKNEHDSIYRKREHPMPIDTLIYEKCRSLLNEKLEELARSSEMISNPKLDKLAELVMTYAEKPENRILILVERTFYTHKICEFLKNHTQLKNIIKPCWLVGQNSTSSKRLNKKEDSVLQQFRSGSCNVLVSTDIIQPGLDLPSCSLVLRYDFVPDSIGSVQARVRARSTDCKYCLITTNSSTNYLKEKDNHERERNLQSALGTWKQLSPEEFKNQVLENKKCLIAEWTQSLIKVETTKLRNVKNTSLTGEIQCRACGYFLGKLDALRQRGESYFISDFDFYNRIDEKMDDEPQEYGKTKVLGKAHCGNKNCRTELGRIVTFKDHPQIPPIYPLKCASVRILRIDEETKKEETISKKQWSAMPFEIVPFDELDSVNNTEVFYDAYENPLQ